MVKYLLIAFLVSCGLLGALAWAEHGEAKAATAQATAAQEARRNAEAALSKANEQAKLQRETSLARQQELNRLRQQSAAQQKALNEALQGNPDWARTELPPGVLDALTSPAAPAGQARPSVAGAGPGAPAPGPH